MATEAQCLTALEEHEEALGRRKNVVGLGVVPLEEDSTSRSKMAVGVYVRKKLPADHLAAKDVVPAMLEVRQGKRIVQVPTRVIEQGKVQKEDAPGKESLKAGAK